MATTVDHERDFEALRERLAASQLAQIVHDHRAIILIEGLSGSAKKASLRQVATALDPCHFHVHAATYDRREAADGHWLARYWRALPAAGNTSIFFRGWYRRVLDDRVSGRVDDASAARAFDEINEFEAQQRDAGTLIVKLFFTVDPAVQQERLDKRTNCAWRRVLRSGPAVMADSPAFRRAFEEMVAHCDTRWSPWVMIDGDRETDAQLATLEALSKAWEDAMPAEPPHLVHGARTAA
jgi:polyphosphate kinase 2 (PPK2 family)